MPVESIGACLVAVVVLCWAFLPAPHTPTGNVQPRVSKEDLETCAKIARKRLGL